uniref:CagE TrbE VirB component of type IV transporter system central domain-containing protein n=1 Tax=mine drainage metagenome TaxID=410659 RepID=E6QPB7_9ZZZZ
MSAILLSFAIATAFVVAIANIVVGFVSSRARSRRNLRTAGFAGELPYRALVRHDTIKLANGGYLGAFEVDGPPSSGMSDEDVSDISIRIANAFNVALDARSFIHCRESYEPLREYDRPLTYIHPVLEWFDGIRAAYFARGRTYSTRRVVAFTVVPDRSRIGKVAQAAQVGESDAGDDGRDRTLRDFDERCEALERSLSQICAVRRLGEYRARDRGGRERWYNGLLEHVNTCVTGRRSRVVQPPLGSSVNGIVALPFRGGYNVCVGDRETQIVVVSQLPLATRDLAFERLRDLSITYDCVVRFLPLDTAQTRSMLDSAKGDWERERSTGKNRLYAERMVADCEEARVAVEDGALRFGHGTFAFVVRSRSIEDAREGARRIASALCDIGYTSHVASLSAEDDYFASLPGVGWAGVRKFAVHTLNLAHVFDFHASSRGRRYVESPSMPAKTPALAYVRASDGVSRRLNLSGDPRDVFGLLGVGSMGRGKSLTLASIGAHWLARVPNGAVVVLEKGRSSYRLCRFLDGTYIEPLSTQEDALGLALFAKLEDPAERRFTSELLGDACTLRKLPMRADVKEAVSHALDSMLTLPPAQRNVKAFCGLLQDPFAEHRSVLLGLTRAGMLGRTLDESVDSLTLSRWMTVELGPLLGHDDPVAHILVLKALLWRLRAMFRRMREQGQPDLHVLFLIDEAKTIIETQEGGKFVSELRREARRDQLGIGLFVQAIEHLSRSPIAAELQEIPVTLWWGNPALRSDESGVLHRQYADFGCPAQGIERVAELRGSSFVVAERETGTSDVVDWVADRAMIALMGRSRPGDNARVDAMRAEHPLDWRERLLSAEGVPAETVEYLSVLLQRYRGERGEEVA